MGLFEDTLVLEIEFCCWRLFELEFLFPMMLNKGLLMFDVFLIIKFSFGSA